ncbi:MAG: hypothetical protein L6R48_09340 [Planctomycetes bacterium]|nr:hypothetical protein [Planctomycetota bacterium]
MDVIDPDPVLASLQDELRAQMAALNEVHHPVYGGDPRRVAALERRVAQLRGDLAARRRELAGAGAA